MSIICKLFGHQTLDGKYGGAEYFKECGSYVDNIGRWHLEMAANCPRCGERYITGKVHVPGVWMYSHNLKRVLPRN